MTEHRDVPYVRARARFEYKKVLLPRSEYTFMNTFQEEGQDGWELVAVTSPGENVRAVAYFKREIVGDKEDGTK